MIGLIGIFFVMMLPLIAGGVTFIYSHEATKDIGNELEELQ